MHKRAEEDNNGAIQTEYAGCLFRSRLEARWAVFFDHAGIKWQYELQGYECKGHRYLPDFYFPDTHEFVEVKGDPEGLQKDYERMSVILGESSPLPGFASGDSSLLLLGDIPRMTNGVVFHKNLSYIDFELKCEWFSFAPTTKGKILTFRVAQGFLAGLFDLLPKSIGLSNKHLFVESRVLQTPGTFQKVNDAYDAARKARFEHGECGVRR